MSSMGWDLSLDLEAQSPDRGQRMSMFAATTAYLITKQFFTDPPSSVARALLFLFLLRTWPTLCTVLYKVPTTVCIRLTTCVHWVIVLGTPMGVDQSLQQLWILSLFALIQFRQPVGREIPFAQVAA